MDASSFAQFFTVILLFVLVLGLTAFATKKIAGFQRTHAQGTNIEIIESYRLSQTKVIEIVRLGSKYVAICVCQDTVTKLCDLSSEDVEAFEVKSDKNSFDSLFRRIKGEVRSDVDAGTLQNSQSKKDGDLTDI